MQQRWAKPAHPYPAEFVGFTGNDKFGGVSCCSQNEYLFWALDSGFSKHDVPGLQFSFNSTGPLKRFALGGIQYEIIRNVSDFLVKKTAQRISDARTFSGHTDLVLSFALCARSGLLVSGGKDGRIVVWDFATATLIAPVKTPSAVTSLAISDDGTQILAGGNDKLVRLFLVTP